VLAKLIYDSGAPISQIGVERVNKAGATEEFTLNEMTAIGYY
jgi:hypothetical protein